MDLDLNSVDEREDDELEVIPEQAEPVPVQEGRPVTIVAEGLSKHFTYKGGLVKAVDGVDFTFTEYQFITIVGPSGSGKSTLLYLLSGLDRPTSGTLHVDGVDVASLSDWQEHHFRRGKLGFVFQSYYLLPRLTALENVMLPMRLAGRMSRVQMRQRASELLLEVGISQDWHHHKPGKLSGGQQQRVAIARALANDPKVILADEPTGNLDLRSSRKIIELLKQLADQGRTVIVVTHDRSITRIADVRLEMVDGKLHPMSKYVGLAETTKKISAKTSWEEQEVTVVAQGVSKHFKGHRQRTIKAVDEASFTFREQQFIAITGPSGSGKSTLLYLLSGLDKATSGAVQVDGIDVRHLSGHEENRFRRSKVGFVFQAFHLLPSLTVLENVMVPMQRAGGRSQEEMRERARLLLFQVEISENRHNYLPSRLSGGQQQRVAIARALANDPKVILADEPTGNLDSVNSRRIIELLRKLADQGKTVIVVTHDRSIARDADVRLDMADGRIRNTEALIPAPIHVSTPVRKKRGKKK